MPRKPLYAGIVFDQRLLVFTINNQYEEAAVIGAYKSVSLPVVFDQSEKRLQKIAAQLKLQYAPAEISPDLPTV